ncbi:MAG: hypothetical protein WBM98_00105 [Maribacter sp.]|uniref:hypothetical protein n=1 Tax=Maribacter sp. TaxID=1897614 RepID=UPI003C766E10
MKFILRLFSWKTTLILSLMVLVLLNVFSFYGLFTNKFYFFKFDNYIFPLMTLVHFAFLYAMWFKIKENEIADPQMRNLEYALYVIFWIYIYRLFNSISILTSYSDYHSHVIPSTFLPIGILIMVLYVLLLLLTIIAFKHRKHKIGSYRFNEINDGIDSWE